MVIELHKRLGESRITHGWTPGTVVVQELHQWSHLGRDHDDLRATEALGLQWDCHVVTDSIRVPFRFPCWLEHQRCPRNACTVSQVVRRIGVESALHQGQELFDGGRSSELTAV